MGSLLCLRANAVRRHDLEYPRGMDENLHIAYRKRSQKSKEHLENEYAFAIGWYNCHLRRYRQTNAMLQQKDSPSRARSQNRRKYRFIIINVITKNTN